MFRLREFALVSLAALAGVSAFLIWRDFDRPALTPVAHFVAPKLRIAPQKPIVIVTTIHVPIPRLQFRDDLPADAVAEPALPPAAVALDPATENEMAQNVAARLSAKVPQALAPYFDLFIYVSKAASGPWGQRLFLFHRSDTSALVFEESFPVSTGREHREQYFGATPTGFFELDSHRFMPMARSAKWDDAQMPWAMFLNYAYRTQMSGVALHAAIGRRELADLGRRASGGCVRLPLVKANELFHRIKATMGGNVPVLAFDDSRGTTNTAGEMVQDSAGNVMVAPGYKVLVFIDPYPGSPLPAQS